MSSSSLLSYADRNAIHVDRYDTKGTDFAMPCNAVHPECMISNAMKPYLQAQ